MKLSKREKILLIISFIALIAVGVYFYVYIPFRDNYNVAKDEYEIVSAQYNLVKAQMKTEDDMDEVVLSYRNQIKELEEELPSAIHLEEVIDIMFTHFYDYEVIINNISFQLVENGSVKAVEDDDKMGIEKLSAPMSVEEILDAYDEDKNLTSMMSEYNASEELSYSNISYMTIGISFVTDYNVLKETLEGLEQLTLTTVLTDLNIGKVILASEEVEVSNNNVSVGLNLSIPFYYDNEEQVEYIFDYTETKGEDYQEHGPFEYEVIENVVDELDNTSKSEPVSNISTEPEFYINLSSSASDQPAQAIQYYGKNDSDLSLNTNADISYSLNLSEKNGKVYFDYSNSIASYPSNSTQMEVVSLNDDIVVNVYSSNRSNEKDYASMTLFLNNSSSKKVLFYVYYDDKTSPRFKVIVNKGNYDIIRK